MPPQVRGAGPGALAALRGFTLTELMVVIVIIGTMLLLVPPNLHKFGSRSRLENSANSVVAAISQARTLAIQDGQPVTLEFAAVKDAKSELIYGHRFVVSSRPAERSTLLNEDGEEDEIDDKGVDEFFTTGWHPMDKGVQFSGVSEKENDWAAFRPDKPYAVVFRPDGSVEKGFAIRVESADEEGPKDQRTITVLVNFLTSEASAVDGLAEMPPQREENEFRK